MNTYDNELWNITIKQDCKKLEENIVMLQELEIFRKAFRGNTKEEEKVHGCKGVKLWTMIIICPPRGKTKGTRSMP